jgi:hypothetical protein
MTAFRAANTASINNTSGSITVNDPGQAGDFLLAMWECDGGGQSCSPPDASWIQILNQTMTTDGGTVFVWYKKVAVGSGSYTFTHTGGNLHMGLVVAAWSGVDNTTPLDGVALVFTKNEGRASPASVPAPSITPATASSTVVYMAIGDPTNSAQSGDAFSPPSGYTTRVAFFDSSAGATSGWNVLCIADQPSVTGATGIKTGTLSRNSCTFGVIGAQIVLRAAPSTGAAPQLPLPPTGVAPQAPVLYIPLPQLLPGAWVATLQITPSGPAPSPPSILQSFPALLSGAWTESLQVPPPGAAPPPPPVLQPLPALLSGSWTESLQVPSPGAAPSPPPILQPLPALLSGAWTESLQAPPPGGAPTPQLLWQPLPSLLPGAWTPQLQVPETGDAPTTQLLWHPLPSLLPGAWTPQLQVPETGAAPTTQLLWQPLSSLIPGAWTPQLQATVTGAAPTPPLLWQPLPSLLSGAWVQELQVFSTAAQPLPQAPWQPLLPLATVEPSGWVERLFSRPSAEVLTPWTDSPVFPDLEPVPPPPPPPPRPPRHTVVGTPGGGFPTRTIIGDSLSPEEQESLRAADWDYRQTEEYKQLFAKFSGLIEKVDQKIETKDRQLAQAESSSRFWAMLTLGIVGGKTYGVKGVFAGLAIATLLTGKPASAANTPKLGGKSTKKLKK